MILNDSSAALKKHWPAYDAEMVTMLLIAENFVEAWDTVKTQFAKTKPLKDKNLFITMMYQSWELCDGVFTKWSEANEITLPPKNTLRQVVAKHLFSA